MMRRLSAARAACLCGVLLSCRTETDAQRRSVLTEFRAAAVDQGWLLAHFNRTGAIVLRPETGARRDMPTAPGYRIYQFASSASGNCLAFSVDAYALTPGMAGGSIYVLDRNGLRGSAEGFFTVIKGLAVDPGCTKVSIDGVYQEVDAGALLGRRHERAFSIPICHPAGERFASSRDSTTCTSTSRRRACRTTFLRPVGRRMVRLSPTA